MAKEVQAAEFLRQLQKVREIIRSARVALENQAIPDWNSVLPHLGQAIEEMVQAGDPPRDAAGTRVRLVEEVELMRKDLAATASELGRKGACLSEWEEAVGVRFGGYLDRASGASPVAASGQTRWEA